jgi:hypothetical protein
LRRARCSKIDSLTSRVAASAPRPDRLEVTAASLRPVAVGGATARQSRRVGDDRLPTTVGAPCSVGLDVPCTLAGGDKVAKLRARFARLGDLGVAASPGQV